MKINIPKPLFHYLFLVVLSVFGLLFFRYNYLIETCELSLFTTDYALFDYYLEQPGGLLLYVALFLTQFLSVPLLGAVLYAMLSVILYWSLIKYFEANNHTRLIALLPPILLMGQSLCMDEYLFINDMGGYFFIPLIGLSLSLFSQLAARHVSSPFYSSSVLAIGSVLLLLFGGTFLHIVWALSLFTLFVDPKFQHRRTASIALYLALCALCYAGAEYLFYYNYPSFTLFSANTLLHGSKIVTKLPSLFGTAAICTLCLLALPRIVSADKVMHAVSYPLLIIALIGLFYGIHTTQPTEMRCTMLQQAEKHDYYSILEQSDRFGKRTPSPTLTYLSLAMNRDLLNRLFEYTSSDRPASLLRADNMQLHPENILALRAIGHFGLSYHLAYENAVFRAPSVFSYRQMGELALINGEIGLAKKYGRCLSNTLFFREEGKEIVARANQPSDITNGYTQKEMELKPQKNMLASLYGDPDALLSHLYVGSNRNIYTLQYAVASILFHKKGELLPAWIPELQKNGFHTLPIAVQEALFMYHTLHPDNLDVHVTEWITDKSIQPRFNEFSRIVQKETPEKAKAALKAFEKTYWYYYTFSPDRQTSDETNYYDQR